MKPMGKREEDALRDIAGWPCPGYYWKQRSMEALERRGFVVRRMVVHDVQVWGITEAGLEAAAALLQP